MQYLFNLDQFFGIKQRRLVVALLASTIVSCSATTAFATTSIVVNATAPKLTLGEGSDDLVTLRSLFQGTSMPEEQLVAGPYDQLMIDLKMKRLRSLHDDGYCDINQQTGEFGFNFGGSFTAGDCGHVAWRLQDMLARGVSPHFSLASFMPPSFVALTQNNRGAETWSTATLDKYKDFARKLVRYIVTKSFDGGAPSVIFEISNELDIADGYPLNFVNDPAQSGQFAQRPLGTWGRWLWWIDTDSYLLHQWYPLQANTYPYPAYGLAYPYTGDVRRLDRGLSPMHKIYADAVDSVRQEISNDPVLSVQYAGKTIEIAGPALAGFTFLWNPANGFPTMEETFLEQILNPATTLNSGTDKARFNSSLDRFSFHYYGSGDNNTEPFSLLRQQVATVRQKLSALGKSNVKLFVSEWGPAAIDVYSPLDINYSHKGAAWAAAFLVEAVSLKISMGNFLLLHDHMPDVTSALMLNQTSLMHKQVASNGSVSYYPKALTNVFKMFARMQGERRPVTLSTTGTSNLGAFATSDPLGATADIIVYNYDHALAFQAINGSLPETAEEFTVRFDNLPDGQVKVERFLVDSETSNLRAFIADPSHSPDLYAVQTLYLQVTNGQLTLPATELKLGVTHWRITR